MASRRACGRGQGDDQLARIPLASHGHVIAAPSPRVRTTQKADICGLVAPRLLAAAEAEL
jgi:hypothetical protein